MLFTATIAVAVLAAATHISAHGVVTSITGANGVVMPGLSIKDGTPRDCSSPGCGSEVDTTILRRRGPPLGKTPDGVPVNAANAVSTFMGTGAAAATKRGLLKDLLTGGAGADAGTGAVGAAGGLKGLIGGLGGGAAAGGAGKAAGGAGGLKGFAGGLGGGAAAAPAAAAAGGAAAGGVPPTGGAKTAAGAVEGVVAATAGKGATSGLPTVGADGTITMTYHQVNQDGAGPLTAAIDPTSGGTDAAAFVPAQVLQNVPGAGIGGLSLAKATDFPLTVQMPTGMKCTGTVAGVAGVCVVKVQNRALAGPFGGSAVFTQGGAAGAAGNATANGATAKRHARDFSA